MHKKILSFITLLSLCLLFFLSCVSARNDSSQYTSDISEKYYREPADGKSGWYMLARLFDTDGKEKILVTELETPNSTAAEL